MKVTGSDIYHAQEILGVYQTGIYDSLTEAAIRNFQLKNGLPASGHIDAMTKEIMFDNDDLSTDFMDRYNMFIQEYRLPYGEYVDASTDKQYIFLHHTAGWNNPYRVIDMWASDNRGRIGTQFVIGGINPRSQDDSYDGVVLKTFDDENYAWHLGRVDRYMHKHSIGIELCNFGWLTKRNNKFYTYANTEVHPNQVVDLGFTFRGYRYWQRYSNKQINTLRDLLIYLSELHGISTYNGLQERLSFMEPKGAFGYFDEAEHGEVKGILSHTSVRTDKFDCFPQQELIDMLMGL